MADPREFRLRLGDTVVALRGPDAAFADALAGYFMQASDPATPDVRLDLQLVTHDRPPQVPSSLILTKTLTDDGFDIAGGLIRGRFDPGSGEGELHVASILLHGRMLRVFEQILYQAFHSACRRAGYGGILVHSAGVVSGGRAFLFVGAADAGKSTIARLAGGRPVLNDEMNLVEFGPDGPEVLGTPFNGFFREKQPGRSPLAAVLLLDKGADHALAPVGPGEAAATVATQVAPPVPLEALADDGTTAAMLDAASRLVHAAPVRRLTFTRDAGFWPLLDDTFTPDTRG
jgi:hypothetical protein